MEVVDSSIYLDIGGKNVEIELPLPVKAQFEQLVRDAGPAYGHTQRFATVILLMRAAYHQGFKDGSATPS